MAAPENGKSGAVRLPYTPQKFAGPIEHEGIVPAGYSARAPRVGLEEFGRRPRDPYYPTFAGISWLARATLEGTPVPPPPQQRLKAQTTRSPANKTVDPKKAKC
jgi:hypothetical protein